MLICPGRIESYVKYAEVAYDLFTAALTMIIDHRGQGRSRPCSQIPTADTVNFSDYVDDLAALWQQQVVPGHWRKRFILLILWAGDCRFSATLPGALRCNSAPRADIRIIIRLPDWMVRHILDWAEGHQRIREDAIGTGRWRRCLCR